MSYRGIIWTIFERKIYENNWQATHLVRKIKQKIKEFDQDMMERVRRNLRAICRDGLDSIC